MEDSFADLLDRLGYNVLRKRDTKSGLDIIAKFYGEPIIKKPLNHCKLLPPFFAPHGATAFSLKRGDFKEKDVTELIEKVQLAKNSKDPKDSILRELDGMVIVTNYTQTEDKIDKLLSRGVYCWDIRRLIFYSKKAQAIQKLAKRNEVEEIKIEGMDNSSYLKEIESSERKNAVLTNLFVFIDSHSKDLIISSDHMEAILKYVYERSLKQIVESTRFFVHARFSIHVLGIANEDLIRKTYNKFSEDFSSHPKVLFSDEPIVFQYGAAPWATLFT
ncbi:MAG: hypothetical protein QXL57_07425 [Candidatus Bathyarchaeia archaeon]